MNEPMNVDFDEAQLSQLPAVLELINLGYTYLSCDEVSALRESESQYVLRDIANRAMRAINPETVSDKSIRDAVIELETEVDLDAGVYSASEQIFSWLIKGRSKSELIDGRRVSPQLKFIDWENPSNNTFHVCVEFKIEGLGKHSARRRPDIVLFVNGIPFAVIENKKPSVKVEEAVQQMWRNQQAGETPKFFLYPQLLVATNSIHFRYGTLLSEPKFYANWRERNIPEADYKTQVAAVINTPVESSIVHQVGADLNRSQFVQNTERKPTEQDCGIYSLLDPKRMLHFVRHYILYDGGIKKAARHQQITAIDKMLAKIKDPSKTGNARSGLIWHTQGSGKSLTMVMLVRAIIEEPSIELPRILVVTDRRDLDRQISETFAACNIKKGVKNIKSAKELIERIRDKDQRVLTTLVHKFGVHGKSTVDADENVFVLIDEAHRTQSGDANTELNYMLPNACKIAFTGTPLMSTNKQPTRSSAAKFGGLVDAYTISEAEDDGIILPLIYQPLFVEHSVNQEPLDRFYDRITKDFTDEQKKDFQKKFNSAQIIEQTSQRIEMIALHITEHFERFLHTGLKAQVVAPSKYAAVCFKEAFDLLGTDIQTEVIISDTNDKEADDQLPDHKKVVKRFLDAEKHKHGSLESREKKLIEQFKKNPDEPHMLIVVDKLLTGFDAPRNTFLYLAKQLKDHSLLQAIARVNRLFEGDEQREAKTNGFVVDYSKNAKNLKDAMILFSNYDPEEVERALLNSSEKVEELENIYQNLKELFKTLKNKDDAEEFIELLSGDLERRERFYELVNEFIKQFATCQMLCDFDQQVDADKFKRYQQDLKKFVELKKIQKSINAETIDFSKYEDQIRRILDKHVSAEYITEMAKPLCVSDVTAFNAYLVDKKVSDKTKAEAIAKQTKKTLSEQYEDSDPEFYRLFSEKIQHVINELKIARAEDVKALLDEATHLQGQVNDYEGSDIPEVLRSNQNSHPYYRNLKKKLEGHSISTPHLSEIVHAIMERIERNKIIDFDVNIEVERKIRVEVEDYLFDVVKDEYGYPLTLDEIDATLDLIWDLAKKNKG
jgi:type I restriction enzyme R subunit